MKKKPKSKPLLLKQIAKKLSHALDVALSPKKPARKSQKSKSKKK